MPTAFTHDPNMGIPSSTTDTAVVRWSGTTGGTILSSGVTIDNSNVMAGITSLTVDNLNLNGNTISSTAGTDLFITPLGGQQLILDGTIIIDAGVVTGATSITSTEFHGGGGNLTGISAGAALSGSTNNTVVTVTGADAMQGEANLTYDGSELKIGSTGRLIIDQGSGDGNQIELRSSDVTHGISGYNTNTYGLFRKKHGDSGMLSIWGFSDTDANQKIALDINGICGVAGDTRKANNANGIIELLAGIKSGSSVANPAANANMVVIRDSASGSAKFIFDEDGDGHSDSSWTTYSDGRLKFNQEVIPYGLETLMQLQPKVYDRDSGYLEDGVPILEGKRNRQIGFIAQEVKELIPEVIKDIDGEATSWYSLDDGKLMAVVVKAIQELNAKVDALTE